MNITQLSLSDLKVALKNAGYDHEGILASALLSSDLQQATYGILFSDGHEQLACGKVYVRYDGFKFLAEF